MVRRLALLWALLLLALPAARAEAASGEWLARAGMGRLESAAEALGAKSPADIARRVFAGEPALDIEGAVGALRGLLGSVKTRLLFALRSVAVPVLAVLLLRLLLGRRDGPLALLCRLSCALSLATVCADALQSARETMAALSKAADALSPVLATALTLTGEGGVAAALTPASALCVDIIENVLKDAGVPLCAVAATVNIAGGLSERLRLDRLFALLKRWTTLCAGLLCAGFGALVSAEGRLAALQDGASTRAVRAALRSAIPFIGRSLSDSAGALVQSASLAKGAVGAAGVALAASVCAGALARLLAQAVSLKLAAAAIEPVADDGIARITAGFGDVAGMLMALCAAALMLDVMLCGTCLGLFSGA